MKRVTFACSEDFEKRLSELAKRAHKKRSAVVFKMLGTMVEFLEMTDAVGKYDFDFLLSKGKEAMISSVQKRS